MKIILMGNAGAGKSALAKQLVKDQQVARLSLDQVAFETGAERRPVEDSIYDVKKFIAKNESWIIEGCYSDIIAEILVFCEELIFLNPGIDRCIAHCRARDWEPEKFISKQQQNENLDNLIEWVSQYETRADEYGLARHRALYESFQGKKYELSEANQYYNSVQLNSVKQND